MSTSNEQVKCPKCGGILFTSERNIRCERYVREGLPSDVSPCNFILWRNELEISKGPVITDELATKLLRGEPIRLTGLKSKAGKKYDCNGILNEREVGGGKSRWGIKFVFDPPQPLGGFTTPAAPEPEPAGDVTDEDDDTEY